MPEKTTHRRIKLSGSNKNIEIKLRFLVEFVPCRYHSVGIRTSPQLLSTLEPEAIFDSLLVDGIWPGVSDAVDDAVNETGHDVLLNGDIEVDLEDISLSLSTDSLSRIELAELGKSLRGMARKAVREVITEIDANRNSGNSQ